VPKGRPVNFFGALVILAVDPGCTDTAWLEYDEGRPGPQAFRKESNEAFLDRLKAHNFVTQIDRMAIEMIASYGMAVGREIFETCVWIGRFVEAWGGPWVKVYRRDVKLHLCQSSRATDSNIRAALIDKFGPPGTKKQPGITYGLARDTWAALAIAVTYAEGGAKP
jgi:hypothetical protein